MKKKAKDLKNGDKIIISGNPVRESITHNAISREDAIRFFNLDPLKTTVEALNEGAIVIFFPEGSRGEPEKLSEFKTGLARLAERCPEAKVIPIFMRGLGRALPKGDFLLVPFVCNVYVGEAMTWQGDRGTFMQTYIKQMEALAAQDKRRNIEEEA